MKRGTRPDTSMRSSKSPGFAAAATAIARARADAAAQFGTLLVWILVVAIAVADRRRKRKAGPFGAFWGLQKSPRFFWRPARRLQVLENN
jgi:hypothetical protein